MTVAKLKHVILSMMERRPKREPMYLMGATVMRMAAIMGHRVERTTDGEPIVVSEMYEVNERGIFLCK